jgi:hypothetical protein
VTKPVNEIEKKIRQAKKGKYTEPDRVPVIRGDKVKKKPKGCK